MAGFAIPNTEAEAEEVGAAVVPAEANGNTEAGDEPNQAAAPSVPTFGQPANTLQPGAPPGFQFGGSQNTPFHQNPPFSQTPHPFQPGGSVEFNAGGSFSLGSTGGDKSGRKFFKAKRDKSRRK